MGAKFYRANYNSKKLRKRATQTRTWARTLKWVCYHAHPLLIAGHPFKGGWIASTGMLANPEMARFQIQTPFLFSPPNPLKVAGAPAANNGIPSFSNFFNSYFGNDQFSMGSPKAGKMLEGMKKCYENTKNEDPVEKCAYYINGFKRAAAL